MTKKKVSPFEFVKAIGERRDDPVDTGELSIEDYNPFMVTRALGHRRDLALAVKLVSSKQGLTKFQHYKILKSLVKPRRNQKGEFWARSEKDDQLKIVMEYMGVGENEAREIIWGIGAKGVNEMKKRLKKSE